MTSSLEGVRALQSLLGTVRRHFTCDDPTADAWALKHWEVALAAMTAAAEPELHVLREVYFGCIVYEGSPAPGSLDADALARVQDAGYLSWQQVIWAARRIAVLTPKGVEALG